MAGPSALIRIYACVDLNVFTIRDAEGGRSSPLTELGEGESNHWGPEYVGGDTILYSVRTRDSRLHALNLESNESVQIDLADADQLEAR